MKNLLLIILIAFIGISASLPSKGKPEWMLGSWKGVGYQIDTKTWEVSLDYSGGDDFKIDYPTLGCGGKWKLLEAKGDRAVFVETIKTGTDRCDQGVKVVVTRVDKRHISLAYFLESYSKDVIAYTVLVKE